MTVHHVEEKSRRKCVNKRMCNSRSPLMDPAYITGETPMLPPKKPTRVSAIQQKSKPQCGPLQTPARGPQQRSAVRSPATVKPTPTTPRPTQWPKPIQAKMTRVGGTAPPSVGVGGKAVQLSRKSARAAAAALIGEEGTITVNNKKYRGYLFINARPVHFDFSIFQRPWPIDLDLNKGDSHEFESDKGKKRTLVPWKEEGLNPQFVFINRNPGQFLRLVVTVQ